MRRPYLTFGILCALIAVALVATFVLAGGDGKQEFPLCNYAAARTATATKVPGISSVEEAQSQVDFRILIPSDLPLGVTLEQVTVVRNQLCPERPAEIGLSYSGPDYWFSLTESRSHVEIGDSSAAPIEINGATGQILRRDDLQTEPLVAIVWNQHGTSISATAFLRGGLTEEQFVRILESID